MNVYTGVLIALDFAIQSIAAVWFFHRLEPESGISLRRRKGAWVVLLLLFPPILRITQITFPQTNLGDILWRFFYRTFIYTVYLRLGKKTAGGTAIYLSLLFSSIYTACQTLTQAPVLLLGVTDTWSVSLLHLFYIPVLVVSIWLIPLEKLYQITKERALTLLIVVVCLLYTKHSLSVPVYENGLSSSALSTYLVLLHCFLLLFLIFFERYAASSQELESKRMQELAGDYLLRNVRTREAGEADLRALHHDMKNHLLAIQELARKGDCRSIETYVQGLQQQSSGYEKRVRTGNGVLDGLLNEKLREADEMQVTCTVAVDFRPAAFMKDVDVCTIFGNALDNALEACGKVEPPGARFLRLRSDVAAGCLFVTLQNSYAGTLKFQGGVPVTTKGRANLHGFGLSNLRRAMETYGGEVQIETEDQCFTMTLILPLPENGSEEKT